MKPFSIFLGLLLSIVVIAVLLVAFGVKMRPADQAATAYNPAAETSLTGTVREIDDFTCPVAESEVGRHLWLQTAGGVVRVHLAPSRILRGQHIDFSPGERIQVIGAKARVQGADDLIAREIVRGQESFIFRDHQGKLFMQQ
jgi:hypothetical protein